MKFLKLKTANLLLTFATLLAVSPFLHCPLIFGQPKLPRAFAEQIERENKLFDEK